MSAHPKFGFDAEFDGDVVVSAPPRKAFFSTAEVEQVRREALAEGQRLAEARADQALAAALDDVRRQIAQAMGLLAKVSHDHRAASAELALAAARKIAGAALERFPDAPARAALEALGREIESYPRLFVRASAAAAERIQETLGRAAETAGYPGQVTVKADPQLAGAAFVFEWGEGRAAFDPQQAAQRVAEALHAALAAEGLHGEALELPEGGPHG